MNGFICKYDRFYKYHTLKDGRISAIVFEYLGARFNVLSICGDTKEQVDEWLTPDEDNHIELPQTITGKDSVEHFRWARKQSREFEGLITRRLPFKRVRIEIRGPNERLRNVYKKGLKDYQWDSKEECFYKVIEGA